MTSRTIMVFTYRHITTILAEGGSQAWKLNPNSASRCTYIVCTRNRYREGAGPEEHHSAFLVGKITNIEVSPEYGGVGAVRYIVRFDEYALIDPPLKEAWKGDHNPVRYVDDIADLGIDVSSLKWKRLLKTDVVEATIESNDGPAIVNSHRLDKLIADAKVSLASKIGVRPDSIDITIRC
jgi:hypothetical protein